jgi:DNA-binding NtrC family response regulator
MKRHEWPGNVRELRNVLERAVLFKQAAREPSMILPVASAPPAAPSAGKHSSAGLHVAVDPAVPFKVAKQELIDEFERRYVRALLDAHGGNISAAARAAGIDRMSIHKILNRLGMDREEKTGDS